LETEVIIPRTGVKEEKILTVVRNVLVVWQPVLLKHVSLGKAESVKRRIDLSG
jgi:hypothetical protein